MKSSGISGVRSNRIQNLERTSFQPKTSLESKKESVKLPDQTKDRFEKAKKAESKPNKFDVWLDKAINKAIDSVLKKLDKKIESKLDKFEFDKKFERRKDVKVEGEYTKTWGDKAKKAESQPQKTEEKVEDSKEKGLFDRLKELGRKELDKQLKRDFVNEKVSFKREVWSAERSASGKVEGQYGTLEGKAKVYSDASISGSAGVKVNAERIEATADLKAKATLLGVEGKVKYTTPGVTVGGKELNASVEAYGKAEITAEGQVEGKVTITRDPPSVVAEGKAGAFAGARAKGHVKFDLGGIITVKGTAEGWAGAGAEASGKIGLENGKFTIGGSAGAGLGLGGKLGVQVDVDVKKAAELAKGLADVDGDGKLSLNDGAAAISKLANGAANLLEKGVDVTINALDADKNGKFTVRDLQLRGQQLKRAVTDKLDLSGDGKVDFRDVAQGIRNTSRTVAQGIEKAGDLAAKGVEIAGEAAEKAVNATKEVIQEAAQEAAENIQKVGDMVVDGAKELAGKVKDKVEDKINDVKEFVGGAVEQVSQAAETLTEGLSSAAKKAKESVSRLFSFFGG